MTDSTGAGAIGGTWAAAGAVTTTASAVAGRPGASSTRVSPGGWTGRGIAAGKSTSGGGGTTVAILGVANSEAASPSPDGGRAACGVVGRRASASAA